MFRRLAQLLFVCFFGCLCFYAYAIVSYNPFNDGEPFQAILPDDLRPTAEYLLLHPQTPPVGVDALTALQEDVVTHRKEVCFFLDAQGRGMDLFLNGARVSHGDYLFVNAICHLDHAESALHCITNPKLVLPPGLHLLELHMTRFGEPTEVYQWALKVEG